MSVNLSVCLSVCPSVNNAYLFVRFTSIFYNSKSDKLKLSLIINQRTSNMILKITRTLELKAFAVPGTLVLVTFSTNIFPVRLHDFASKDFRFF